MNELKYENNLLFYMILKNLIKSRLTDKKIVALSDMISKQKNLNFLELIELLKNSIVKENASNYDDFVILLNLCNIDNYEMWCDLMLLSLDLLFAKKMILNEAKLFSSEQDNIILNSTDKLSFNYDLESLVVPYGQRVISSLLVFSLTKEKGFSNFGVFSSSFNINNLYKKIELVTKKYGINVNNIFMIIVDESNSQSIKSNAGSTYEKRVEDRLKSIDSNLKEKMHDSLIPSVEYDYVLEFNGKTYGFNVKRTLRERYKQNFEDVDRLSVDGVFLITLGLDLNLDKLTNIMQRHGYFVVVAKEVYDNHEYLRNNKRVIPSDKFDKKNLKRILDKFV